MTKILLSIVTLFSLACASTPIIYGSKTCVEWHHCGATADCAAHLYNKASAVMSHGRQLVKNGLYNSAVLEYQRAAHMLRCADAKLTEAQLNDFEDWKVANVFGLGKKIKQAIKECDQQADRNKWRR